MEKKIKTTTGILVALLLFFAVLFLIFFKLGLFSFESANNANKGEVSTKLTKEEIRDRDYTKAFNRIVEGKYFSFPIEKTVSFGENKDMEKQIGRYEEVAKNKEGILMMEFKDANNQIREAYVKALDFNDENISYVLRHYTNYFDSHDLSQTTLQLKFTIDEFKDEEYKKEINSGTILTSDDKIFVIMSNDQSVEPFLKIFKENNDTKGEFLNYLENNQNVLKGFERKTENKNEAMKQVMQRVPNDAKKFASDFWKVWITLNTDELQQYYADKIWFYAGDEWFKEWNMKDPTPDKVHNFTEVEKEKLLEAYQELKAEDFKEDLSGMRKLTDDIRVYPAAGLMNICDAEDQKTFFNHFQIKESDIIMIVRLDNSNTCTVDGEFFGGEMRFFVIRDIGGEYKVVTDFTE